MKSFKKKYRMLPKQHWNVLTVSDFFPFFLYSPVEIFFKNKYCFEFKVKKKKVFKYIYCYTDAHWGFDKGEKYL